MPDFLNSYPPQSLQLLSDEEIAIAKRRTSPAGWIGATGIVGMTTALVTLFIQASTFYDSPVFSTLAQGLLTFVALLPAIYGLMTSRSSSFVDENRALKSEPVRSSAIALLAMLFANLVTSLIADASFNEASSRTIALTWSLGDARYNASAVDLWNSVTIGSTVFCALMTGVLVYLLMTRVDVKQSSLEKFHICQRAISDGSVEKVDLAVTAIKELRDQTLEELGSLSERDAVSQRLRVLATIVRDSGRKITNENSPVVWRYSVDEYLWLARQMIHDRSLCLNALELLGGALKEDTQLTKDEEPNESTYRGDRCAYILERLIRMWGECQDKRGSIHVRYKIVDLILAYCISDCCQKDVFQSEVFDIIFVERKLLNDTYLRFVEQKDHESVRMIADPEYLLAMMRDRKHETALLTRDNLLLEWNHLSGKSLIDEQVLVGVLSSSNERNRSSFISSSSSWRTNWKLLIAMASSLDSSHFNASVEKSVESFVRGLVLEKESPQDFDIFEIVKRSGEGSWTAQGEALIGWLLYHFVMSFDTAKKDGKQSEVAEEPLRKIRELAANPQRYNHMFKNFRALPFNPSHNVSPLTKIESSLGDFCKETRELVDLILLAAVAGNIRLWTKNAQSFSGDGDSGNFYRELDTYLRLICRLLAKVEVGPITQQLRLAIGGAAETLFLQCGWGSKDRIPNFSLQILSRMATAQLLLFNCDSDETNDRHTAVWIHHFYTVMSESKLQFVSNLSIAKPEKDPANDRLWENLQTLERRIRKSRMPTQAVVKKHNLEVLTIYTHDEVLKSLTAITDTKQRWRR